MASTAEGSTACFLLPHIFLTTWLGTSLSSSSSTPLLTEKYTRQKGGADKPQIGILIAGQRDDGMALQTTGRQKPPSFHPKTHTQAPSSSPRGAAKKQARFHHASQDRNRQDSYTIAYSVRIQSNLI